MRIKYSGMIRFLLYLCIFIYFPWSSIGEIPLLSSSYNKIFILLIGLITLWMIINKNGKELGNFKYANKYIIFVYTCIFVEMLYSILKYTEQGFIDVILGGYGYLLIILVPVFLEVFLYDGGYERICVLLNIYTFAWCVLALTQSILYPLIGIVFLHGIDLEWSTFLNTDVFIRINLSAIPHLMFLYDFSLIMQKKAKKFETFCCILSGICIFFVEQTRAMIVAISVAVLIMFIMYSKNSIKVMRNVIIVFVLLFLILQSDYANSFLGSFLETSSKNSSTTARVYAIEYYVECFLQSPLFGNGFTHSEDLSSIEHGAKGIAYYSDVGIVGLMASMGVLGVSIFVVYLIRLFYILYKIFKWGNIRPNIFLVGIFAYSILTMPTLIMTNSGRLINFIICIAISEYVYWKEKNMRRMLS